MQWVLESELSLNPASSLTNCFLTWREMKCSEPASSSAIRGKSTFLTDLLWRLNNVYSAQLYSWQNNWYSIHLSLLPPASEYKEEITKQCGMMKRTSRMMKRTRQLCCFSWHSTAWWGGQDTAAPGKVTGCKGDAVMASWERDPGQKAVGWQKPPSTMEWHS